MEKDKAKIIKMSKSDVDSVLGEYYDEQEKEEVESIESSWQYLINDIGDRLYRFRDIVKEQREDVISQRALIDYNYIIEEINHFLGEDYWEDDFVLDPEHIEELKEARREAALNEQLEELTNERQRYFDAIQDSEVLIAKLREKNSAPSIIDGELALIDKNKKMIEDLNSKIEELEKEIKG